MFLPNLGIPAIDLARDPSSAAFPLTFNINNQHIWDSVVKTMNMGSNPESNWETAVRLYIRACAAIDAYPFSNIHQSANDKILAELNEARKAVVKFLDRSRMLSLVGIRTTRREVQMTTFGFVLSVYGLATLRDPTFEQWLLGIPSPGFRLKHEGRYIKTLSRNLTMVVYNDGAGLSQRWHVGYELTIHGFPEVPGRHLPSRSALERFVLDIMWLPILKSHRPQGFHHRLI